MTSPTIRHIAQQAGVSIGSVSRVLNNHKGISDEVREKVLSAARALGYDTQNLRPTTERVGLADIAEYAQLSLGSVSRAIKGVPGVSSETQRRVLEAARRLGYNTQNLRVGRLNRVGFLIHRGVNALSYNPFYGPVLHGAEEACRTRKLAISYATVGTEDDIPELVAQQQVDGLLSIGYFEPHLINAFRETGKPIVLVDHFVQNLPSVNSNNFEGARQAVQHLTNLGRRRIAFISGPVEHHSVRERQRGYRQALYDARIPADPALEAPMLSRMGTEPRSADLATQSPARAARTTRRRVRSERPDGDARHQCVPRSRTSCAAGCRVRGFDDLEAAAYFDRPQHQSVCRRRSGQSGALALLLDSKSQRSNPQRSLPTTLIVRESSQSKTTMRQPRRSGRAR
ncbi:MAG: LacI family DNA-binding transcriptional regulator [Pleurocapsa sp. SU_196_0]|nr:LacI family DNA-binding transcriptional regulator [Pleurocapsa sp. SU_196_0]